MLWRLVRRLFGKPKGRHARGLPLPPPRRPAPEPAARSAEAPPPPPSGPSVRLIFEDGTVATLPPGSGLERRARYLADNLIHSASRHPDTTR